MIRGWTIFGQQSNENLTLSAKTQKISPVAGWWKYDEKTEFGRFCQEKHLWVKVLPPGVKNTDELHSSRQFFGILMTTTKVPTTDPLFSLGSLGS